MTIKFGGGSGGGKSHRVLQLCTAYMRQSGVALIPRTCPTCKLGPCHYRDWIAPPVAPALKPVLTPAEISAVLGAQITPDTLETRVRYWRPFVERERRARLNTAFETLSRAQLYDYLIGGDHAD